ncbi:MAG: RHS repeat-associated core domain-containing protein, partial [Candidatus Omnitrophota bacterium]|nr:RHS repeat-associated core domain-containing protein [Candidatus Omnitrophota bacterium]
SDGWTMTYDANGNLLVKDFTPSPSHAVTQSLFSYDAENRLTEVQTAPEETVTLRFEPGWNFFSLPVIPDDLHITALFPTFAADFEQLAWFDANPDTPEAQRFKSFVNHPKFNDFDTLAYGQGYQLYCTNPAGISVTFKGKLPTQQASTNLLPGWHLLPTITVDEPKPLSWLLGGVSYDQAALFNPATQQLEPATTLKPGEAAFVHVVSPSFHTPPLPKDVTTRFVYDGDGGRVKQTTASGTTTYLGESYELAPDGTTTKYVFAGSQRIAAKESTGALRFYHTDHLGSSNVITDSTGTVIELAEYTPYGSLNRREGSVTVPQKFTGQRLDTTTGLYFYNARYYDPSLGRFIQADPVVPVPGDPQALNRYSYVRNNPLTYTDPSGHGWRKIFGWVSTALSFLLPPLAPFFMAANIGLGLYDAARTGNWMGFIGSTVGSLVGSAIGGGLGQQMSLGITNTIGSSALQTGLSGFLSGAISGAAEFGLAGFGAGFGGALGGGASLSEAFQAGGLSAAISGGFGAAIQGSYLGGLQGALHGNSIERIAGAQGYTLVPMGSMGGPMDPAGTGAASATATRQQMGNIHPARLFKKWGVGINKAVKLNHLQAAGILSANDTWNGVYANWMSDARISAQLVSGGKPIFHRPHGGGAEGFYPHFHALTVDGKKMNSHAWFGQPTN